MGRGDGEGAVGRARWVGRGGQWWWTGEVGRETVQRCILKVDKEVWRG